MSGPVHVILVHWNQAEACVQTADRFLDQAGVAVTLTVVDNGSDPAHLRVLRADLAGRAELVEVGFNSGFGGAANVGLRRWLDAGAGEWVAVAPHDACPDEKAIATIVDGLVDQPDVGLVSADVGDGFTPIVEPFLGTIDGPQTVREGFEDADYAHGTLHLFRRPCIRQIGVFDERYFAYCEEADLGLRAKAAGWRVGVMRGATVHNPHSSTPHAVIDYLKERNTLLLLRDHYGWRQAAFRGGVAAWQLIAGLVDPSTRAHFYDPGARLRALIDAARGRYGPPPSALTR